MNVKQEILKLRQLKSQSLRTEAMTTKKIQALFLSKGLAIFSVAFLMFAIWDLFSFLTHPVAEQFFLQTPNGELVDISSLKVAHERHL